MSLVLNITPVPKPRQTQADRWKQRPPVLRYRAFADEIRLQGMGRIDMNGRAVLFVMPMPKSWSKKKKREMDDQPHQQKPDIDNLGKALLDAMYGDDSHIWDITLRKRWGTEGRIIITCP